MATFKQALEDYSECPEDVYLVLQKVLEIEEVQSLAGIKFRCLFFTKPKFKNGEKVWAETRVLSTRDVFIVGAKVLIQINKQVWDLYPEQREALLFHELCHLWLSEDGKLKTVGHDIEEFYAVIRRFGDWKGQVEEIKHALAVQLSLDLLNDDY